MVWIDRLNKEQLGKRNFNTSFTWVYILVETLKKKFFLRTKIYTILFLTF